MRILIIILALSVVSSHPTVETWNLDEISTALSDCSEDSCSSNPALVDALNKIMYALFTEKGIEDVFGALPSPSGSKFWTREEILNALQNRTVDEKYRSYLVEARTRLDYQKDKMNSVQVLIPAMDISTWTLDDLSEELNDTAINPRLIPYLENAYMQLKDKIKEEKTLETISIATPVGLVKHTSGTTVLIPIKKNELYGQQQ